jgi:predicted protein tyrosine phosphatase
MTQKNYLFICNQAKHRSKTAFELFGGDYAGIYSEHNPLKKYQLEWADILFVMEEEQRIFIGEHFPKEYLLKQIINLNIPDIYDYNTPELKIQLRNSLSSFFKKEVIQIDTNILLNIITLINQEDFQKQLFDHITFYGLTSKDYKSEELPELFGMTNNEEDQELFSRYLAFLHEEKLSIITNYKKSFVANATDYEILVFLLWSLTHLKYTYDNFLED